MKCLNKTLLLLTLTFLSAFGLTSCGETDPYYETVEGQWELIAINDYPVAEYDVVEFTFYRGGTGIYGQYQGGFWVETRISWNIDVTSGGASYLNVYPGGGDMWSYMVHDYGTQIELTDLYNGNRLLFQAF